MKPPLYLDITLGESNGQEVQATVSLAKCRNCGKPKATSDPCGFDHLAALMELGAYLRGEGAGDE